MDYPEFIARVTSHIPDKGQRMIRSLCQCPPGQCAQVNLFFLKEKFGRILAFTGHP
jgi:hypothetical protein